VNEDRFFVFCQPMRLMSRLGNEGGQRAIREHPLFGQIGPAGVVCCLGVRRRFSRGFGHPRPENRSIHRSEIGAPGVAGGTISGGARFEHTTTICHGEIGKRLIYFAGLSSWSESGLVNEDRSDRRTWRAVPPGDVNGRRSTVGDRC